mmetsp:Transcript_9239/g.30509  ORF Transcript_9239/g.30509 Transcript_9239/m.30509 type:complete len:217 (-) Transcript_9239:1926-2576(-)
MTSTPTPAAPFRTAEGVAQSNSVSRLKAAFSERNTHVCKKQCTEHATNSYPALPFVETKRAVFRKPPILARLREVCCSCPSPPGSGPAQARALETRNSICASSFLKRLSTRNVSCVTSAVERRASARAASEAFCGPGAAESASEARPVSARSRVISSVFRCSCSRRPSSRLRCSKSRLTVFLASSARTCLLIIEIAPSILRRSSCVLKFSFCSLRM